MSVRPAYFELIRQRAAERWDQLEQDPELAGPWHQLFKQVQSPRHILSELLQNADDANATETAVCIEDSSFIFKHNGEDFSEEHFASLCRFGYSNKRALHTIGFRGIGFKSTFSLGGHVKLSTPTLSVAFDQDRFTEPKWVEGHNISDNRTSVLVPISDEHRLKEVAKNLDSWKFSPVSLLFFKNIRRLQINETELHWGSFGAGPIDRTEWLALHDNDQETYLIARSELEPFPDVALEEIRQERMLGGDEEAEFPPCSVEIVLGAEGRLYVVLPTGVKTNLPFACNAPFIQDPARMKIKDPETSPTNRWLLNRAGKLAAETMLKWLAKKSDDILERIRAYDLMPDVDREDQTLEGVCATIVETAFSEVIENQNFLLTDENNLVASGECITIPQDIYDVWPGQQAAFLIDDEGRPSLSRYVSRGNVKKLVNWEAVKEFDDTDVLESFENKHLPKPQSWKQLLSLWSYVAPIITTYRYHGSEDGLCIVPVQGKEVLCSAKEVIRLGEKKILPNEEDWHFLGDRLSVLNQNWVRFITEQKRISETTDNVELSEKIKEANAVFKAISLDEPNDTSRVINQVAGEFFNDGKVTLIDAIRIAQIAAKLNASVGSEFRFVTQDRKIRKVDHSILFDEDGSLDTHLPEEWCEEHLLHEDYFKSFGSCNKEEWMRWLASGRSGLHRFVPFQSCQNRWVRRPEIENQLKLRGFSGRFNPRYQRPSFHIDDWRFDSKIWAHWEALAEEDSSVWGWIVEKIISQPERIWSKHLTAIITEEASNGHSSRVVRSGLTPSWIMQLREKKCLKDTHGVYRRPAELLRRTPETEALMDVEIFVHGLLDNENSRPILKLLGVGDEPTGPDRLLSRLQSLSKSATPPIHEVEKWYRRLDQLIDNCSTENFTEIRRIFAKEHIILAASGKWENTLGVFLSADDEDVPGAEVIRESVADLTLWRKVGVADRPTVALAIDWLTSIPSGKIISPEELRRVRSLLTRYPLRIWEECQHWLNLANEWIPVGALEYALTMQTLFPWSHLHQWVKQKTADFQKLPTEITETIPFSELPPLAAHVKENFHQKGATTDKGGNIPWLRQLGKELRRIVLDDKKEQERIRELASALMKTVWLTSDGLETVPYINGKPAGTPRRAEAIWIDQILYAEDRPIAKLARSIAQELRKSFGSQKIAEAIMLCFDRSPEFIIEYMEENFKLAPHEQVTESETSSNTNADSIAAQPTCADEDIQNTQINESLSDANVENSDVNSFTNGRTDTGDQEEENEICANDDVDSDEMVAKPRVKSKPHRPSIMERFALRLGYRKDGNNRFYDDQGNWIAKTNGSLFPWEQRSPTGDVIRHFWPKDHCLEHDPLELDAEIWGIVEKYPETYFLVLSNLEGFPKEISGTQLGELRETGAITLHPSTYRIVYENDQEL